MTLEFVAVVSETRAMRRHAHRAGRRRVPCPHCNADIGRPCRTVNGRHAMKDEHSARAELARTLGKDPP